MPVSSTAPLQTYIYRVRDALDYAWNDYVAEGPKGEFSALLGAWTPKARGILY
eukprot:SAG31_NODE_4929_length_2855_cov_1.699057_3_plen_53_part_00